MYESVELTPMSRTKSRIANRMYENTDLTLFTGFKLRHHWVSV